MLRIFDYILIVALIIFAISFNFIFIAAKQAEIANSVVVTFNGDFFASYPLDVDGEYTIITEDNGKEHTNVLKVENSIVSMVDADCPDSICVQTKPIEYNFDTIACLPNKVLLQIVSDDPEKESQIDSFVQ